MRIKKIKLKKFRCFGPDEAVLNLENLSALIGANSSGKTAVLHALLKLFGTRNKEREITRSDFHIPKEKKPEDIDKNSLFIEVIIDFPELDSVEKTIENTIPTFFQRMVVERPNADPFVRLRLEATWEKSNTPEGNIESRLIFITVPEGQESEDEGKIIPADLSNIRSTIHMIYVPAIREPSPQLKNTSGTILSRILNGINWPMDFDRKIKDKISEVDSIFDDQDGVKIIQEIINTQWKSLHTDIRYTEAKVRFNCYDLASILKKIDVEFSPTELPNCYKIDSLGEGLRSLFYLSLVNSLLEFESKALKENTTEDKKIFNILPPVLTILAVEEPENHISPHILGKVINNLIELSNRDNAQVFISSHTPAVIKRIEPESISHLRICKEKLCTISNDIILPKDAKEAFKYVKAAVKSYPEIYFARLVLLCEGSSEEIILAKAFETLGLSLDLCGISIVPLGGRFVNHFWNLLNQLEIPHITLLDLDSERKFGGWGRIKYAFVELLKNGNNKEELFPKIEDNILSDDEYNNMQNWQLNNSDDREKLNSYVNHLKKWHVYFSTPLDVDFSMLLNFKDCYKSLAPERGGPRIPNKTSESERYAERLENALSITLKMEGGDGNSYTEAEKELMIWYNYLFLNRGKPSTHLLAISKIDGISFKNNLPSSLKELIEKTYEILSTDPKSDLYKQQNGKSFPTDSTSILSEIKDGV